MRAYLPHAAIFLITLTVYGITMPRTITLEDAGLFQMVCHLGGIGHPPGYPLFTNICQAVVPFFPVGVVAGNTLTATFAALACAIFYSCVRCITDKVSTALIAALALGFSATFWSEAITIEVYSLAVLGYVACWRLLLSFRSESDVHILYLAGFCYGLSLANHWPLMILSTPALLLTLVPRWSSLLNALKRIRICLISIICLLAGLLPYLCILFVSDPAVALLGAVNSPGELASYIARSVYVATDQQIVAGMKDRIAFISWSMERSLWQFGMAGIPLVLLGAIAAFRRLPVHLTIQLITLLLGSTLVLNGLLNFSYEYLYQAIFDPYLVISCLALAFWFAMGCEYVMDQLKKRTREPVAIAAGAGIVVSVLLANFSANHRADNTWIETYGRTLLASLPQNAIYFANDEFETGVLGYLHKVEGVRPDIELRSWGNQFYDNRLASPVDPAPVQQAAMEQFLESTTRPVFSASASLYPREQRGAYFRYTPGAPRSVARTPEFDATLDYLLDLYSGDLIEDPHELSYAYQFLISFSRQYVALALTRNDLTEDELVRLQRLQSTFPGMLATLETLVPLGRDEAKHVLETLAHRATSNIPEVAPRQSRGLIYEYLGRIAVIAPADNPAAMNYLERSLDIYPSAGNMSICALLDIYREQGLVSAEKALLDRYPAVSCLE